MRYLKLILLFTLLSCPFVGKAQEVVPQQESQQEPSYTDQLKQEGTSGAVVVVHQDADIENLVNGVVGAAPVGGNTQSTVRRVVRTDPSKTPGQGTRTKETGFRVQIYMAGNTAQDKATVKNWARRFKTYFPSVNAYVYFSAPHWVCTAGDFRTREDANALLTRVRATGQFASASIVKAKVNGYY